MRNGLEARITLGEQYCAFPGALSRPLPCAMQQRACCAPSINPTHPQPQPHPAPQTGIVNGGIISTLIDCHGNWTAAVALMDRSCLPAPPLTLTASILVSFKEPAPPGAVLIVRSNVVEIKEGSQPGVGKVGGGAGEELGEAGRRRQLLVVRERA